MRLIEIRLRIEMINLIRIHNAKQSLEKCHWKFQDIKLSKSDKKFLEEIKRRKEIISTSFNIEK